MKSQGLPINFIVLAAVGIFVLILAIIFVISGGTSATAAMSPQQVRNSCNTACVGLVQWAAGQATRAASHPGWEPTAYTSAAPRAYCNNWTITGVSSKVYGCNNAAISVSCPVTFSDGTGCTAGCQGGDTGLPYC